MGILDGKVTLITGAGHGIGRATALLFAREGAAVVVNDNGVQRDGSGGSAAAADQVVTEIRQAGGTAEADYESVGPPDSAVRMVEGAIGKFGQLDVLINNAGILLDKTLLNMTFEQWDAVLRVHLTGTFLCLQAAARHMKQRSAGSIVNTTSFSGLQGNFGQANYSAAKAGVYGLTRTASIELQRYGIRVNAVAPMAKTRMTEDLPVFEKVGEALSPEHVAPVHLFLASDLSRDISGVALAVAGARLSAYRVVESPGKHKESADGIWTAQEIAEQFKYPSKLRM